MYDQRFLQSMYQQWCNDNSNYIYRWVDFVEMAARHANVSSDVMMCELQKYYWFKWTREE